MKPGPAFLLGCLCFAFAQRNPVLAQNGSLGLPQTIEAGSAFSIQSSGSGSATLFIVGLGQVLKRDLQLGAAAYFPVGSLYDAGNYVVFLSSASADTLAGQLNVVPAKSVAQVRFLAAPSRLPVGLHSAITGAVYAFDAWQNLITDPKTVSFQLSGPSGAVQTQTETTNHGVAWIGMDSTQQEGIAKFQAQIGNVSDVRIIRQIPGDPCGLKMSATQSGPKVQLQTDPVRDCEGNAVPDGTIITFTESYSDAQTTVDVPLKHGIATVDVPVHQGATISVASGVALGNQIHLEK